VAAGLCVPGQNALVGVRIGWNIGPFDSFYNYQFPGHQSGVGEPGEEFEVGVISDWLNFGITNLISPVFIQ